jgi:putative nucleotidyltransferase with HDIG domain
MNFKEGFASFFSFRKSGFDQRIKAKHFLLGFAFVLTLTFFLHYQEVRVEHLELNEVAEKGVLARTSFSFSDTEATSFLKQEAMRDVGVVRYLDTKQILQINKEVENELSLYPDWRDKIPGAIFDDIYECKEKIRNVLQKIHFIDERTFQRMKDLPLSIEGYLIFNPENPGEKGLLPPEIWEEIHAIAFSEASPASHYVSNLFGQKMWAFQEDLGARNRIRQEVKKSIPPRKTDVEVGTWIIQSGEKVTNRQIDMMRGMKKALMDNENRLTFRRVTGSFIQALIFTTLIVLYLQIQNQEVLRSFRRIALLATIIILSLILSKVTEFVILNKAGSLVDIFCYPIVILFGALLSCLLLDVQISFIVSVFLSVVLGITLAVKADYFLVMNLSASLVGILSVRKIRRRKEIFEVCAKVWLAVIPIIMAFNFFQNHFWTFQLVGELFAAFVFISLTAIIVVGLLPVLEAGFDVVTDMTLMEYIDPNHPLLHRLSMEAPGTYQHSCIVGIIAEAAAQAIHANGLFCRVAALYHDTGKLSNPQYFTENQIDNANPHNGLTPFDSAQVIRAHVSDGISLGRQYGLPQSLMDIIPEHHGTGVIYFFYFKEIERAGSAELVDVNSFRYLGPRPRTKESAIIMISDSIEAAFSSLSKADESILQALIEEVVGKKIHDKQLDDCKLTFEELGIIKKVILKTLLVIGRSRVKFPEKKHLTHTSLSDIIPV